MSTRSLPWYRSILAKMALIILLLLIPSFLLYLWAYTSFNKEMRHTMEELALASDNLILNEFENRITGNVVQQYILYNNNDLVMAASLWDYYDDTGRAERIKRIQETLRFFGMLDNLVREVTLYVPSSGISISTTTHSSISPEKQELLQEWAAESQLVRASTDGIFAISRSAAMSGDMPRFICEVQLSEHFFYNLLNQLSLQGGGILSIDGYCLYSQNSDRVLQQEILQHYLANQAVESLNETLTVGGNQVLYYHMRTSISNVSLILYRPYSRTLRNIQTQAQMIPMFLAISLLIIVFLLMYMQGFIRRPIIKLSLAFEQLNASKKDVRVYSRRTDEFNELFENFNYMSAKLQDTIAQVYQQQIEIQRAELKQLQSQIDPHFLYNSFFLLKNRIRRSDSFGAMDLANLLGEYFKFITRDARDFVPLEEEYLHAEVYAKIQSNRFGERFEMDFEFPKGLENLQTPRLILQPIVENSIKYCVEASETATTIRLGFLHEGDRVLINIENSGYISDDDIAKLSDMLTSPQDEVTALLNIHRRLCIYNNSPDMGISFRRSSLGGLAVNIKLSAGREDSDV